MSVYSPKDLVEGPVRLYIALPASNPLAPAPPANTVLFGGAWPSGWRNLGYSSRDPLEYGGLSAARTPVYSGQQRGQIASFQGEVNEMVTFRIISRTMQNLRDLAARGVLSQIAPGVSTQGEIRIVWSDTQIEQMALGIEAYGTNGRLFRAYYPVGSFAITSNLPYGYGADRAGQGISASFTSEGGPDYPVNWWEVLPPTG